MKVITLEELLKLLSINSKKIENLSSRVGSYENLPFNLESDLRNLYMEKEVLNKLIDYIALKELNNKETKE